MLEVGLTGGIACGKTVIRRRFDASGVPTLDADRVVHGLFAPGTEVTREIAEHFGAHVLASDSPERQARVRQLYDLRNPVVADVAGEDGSTRRTVIPRASLGGPPPEAIAELRADPSSAAEFDEIFGPGAARRALGY